MGVPRALLLGSRAGWPAVSSAQARSSTAGPAFKAVGGGHGRHLRVVPAGVRGWPGCGLDLGRLGSLRAGAGATGRGLGRRGSVLRASARRACLAVGLAAGWPAWPWAAGLERPAAAGSALAGRGREPACMARPGRGPAVPAWRGPRWGATSWRGTFGAGQLRAARLRVVPRPAGPLRGRFGLLLPAVEVWRYDPDLEVRLLVVVHEIYVLDLRDPLGV